MQNPATLVLYIYFIQFCVCSDWDIMCERIINEVRISKERKGQATSDELCLVEYTTSSAKGLLWMAIFVRNFGPIKVSACHNMYQVSEYESVNRSTHGRVCVLAWAYWVGVYVCVCVCVCPHLGGYATVHCLCVCVRAQCVHACVTFSTCEACVCICIYLRMCVVCDSQCVCVCVCVWELSVCTCVYLRECVCYSQCVYVVCVYICIHHLHESVCVTLSVVVRGVWRRRVIAARPTVGPGRRAPITGTWPRRGGSLCGPQGENQPWQRQNSSAK